MVIPNMENDFSFDNRILTLKCPDTYDFLPLKIFLMIKTILIIHQFKNISHIIKINDHDTKYDASVNNILGVDYGGRMINRPNDSPKLRTYHFNKVPVNSIWHNKIYDGNFVPWVNGGYGYILSRKSLEIINKRDINEINNHIYEDVMIALFLFDNNIFPEQVPLKIQKIKLDV
jgi:hypothetical protein